MGIAYQRPSSSLPLSRSSGAAWPPRTHLHKALDTLTKIRKSRAAERKLAESKSAATEPVEVASQPEPPPAYPAPATPEPRTLVMRKRSQPPEQSAPPVDASQPAPPLATGKPRSVSAFFNIKGAENFLALALSGNRPTLERAAPAAEI